MTLAEFLRPFDFEFFRNGLIVATLAGALCGLVGTFVVLRGMSYIGHGLSHAIFGGFAASALLGVNLFLGAGLWGFASALMIGSVTRRRAIGSDAAIGVITTASFAIGLALLKVFGSAGKNPDSYLFGNVLGVDRQQVGLVLLVTIVAGLVVFFAYRPLLFATFDPDVADVSGVPTARIDALLMLLLAATILTTMNVLGVMLVAATLVIPPVVARMLTNSFSRMLLMSTAIGAASGFIGMVASYHLDIPSGPMIVLVGTAAFAAVFAATGVKGLRNTRGLDAA
ncbi:MAG TPA: metal ABC transporter permease [Acidimicrobiales bacterium]|jgi:ABC-type Mn2+/Zn2+ transport system permease subunit|nr:metal ABC transporter permease [Acidimicrobiales bacterium]